MPRSTLNSGSFFRGPTLEQMARLAGLDPLSMLDYDSICRERMTEDEAAQSAARYQRIVDERRGAYDVNHPDHPDNSGENREQTRCGRYTYRKPVQKLKFTLGWELEANHAPMRCPQGVARHSDASVDGDAAEFVVMPAITKSPRYVLALLKELVHAPQLNTNKSCGFHVHISASNLSLNNMRKWAAATEHLGKRIEAAAFRAVPESREGNEYCRPIQTLSHGDTFTINKYSNGRRYHWLNTVEMFRPAGIRTIENRLLGNTHRWKYLLSWVLFSLELGRRGWDLANNPYDMTGHARNLRNLLKRIERDIKPLEKRHEPVPAWVYDGLQTFDIEASAFERPLARLVDAEADALNRQRRFYSDEQATIAGYDNDDEERDDDSCACGCGADGRCDAQMHEDGDCDSSDCYVCCDNGDCVGSAQGCFRCIERAHDNDEDCEQTYCQPCGRPRPRQTDATPSRNNVRIHEGNGAERRSPTGTPNPMSDGTIPSAPPVTATEMQAELNRIRSERMDAAQAYSYQYIVSPHVYESIVNDVTINGTGMTRIDYEPIPNSLPTGEVGTVTHTVFDESVDVGSGVPDMTVNSRIDEHGRVVMCGTPSMPAPILFSNGDGTAWELWTETQAINGGERMLDQHEEALSADREHFFRDGQAIDHMTITEIRESCSHENRMNERGGR